MADKLAAGDPFPELELTPVDGTPLIVPRDLSSDYHVLLFYRGHW